MTDITARDVELPDNSIALILTDRKDGTFSTAIVGGISTVPEELLTLAVGAKRLMFMDQKTVMDAALEAAEDAELEAADDVEWVNRPMASA